MTSKIWVLVWKDLLRRKNSFITTCMEVFIPITLVLIVQLTLPVSTLEKETPSISFEAFNRTQCIPKYSHYGKIIYEPSTPFIDKLMSRAACYAGYKKSNVAPGNLHGNNSVFSIGVKFENASADDHRNTLNYTLFPTNNVWNQMNYRWRVYPFAIPRYSTPTVYTVTELQRAIDVSYLSLRNIPSAQVDFEDLHVYQRSPSQFSVAIHICFFLAITLMVPPIVGRTVQEKFTGAKELMLTMGVIRWQLWVAKFFEVLLFPTITISAMVLFLYDPMHLSVNYLKVVSPLIFWSVLMYGLIGIILFLFFVSCIFDTPSVAVYVTQIFWSLSLVFKGVLSSFIEEPGFVRYLLCLFPHVSFLECVGILLTLDDYGKDVKLLENLTGKDDSLRLLYVLSFMALNILLYMVLTWYLEQVKPGRYGIRRPYNFCFKRYYWFPRKSLPLGCRPREQLNENFELIETDDGLRHTEPGVSIKGVEKLYSSSDKSFILALDNVHLDFYRGEISGVLGHNGAGKTTLFSIITGMIEPSGGKVFINGFDMSINTSEARQSIGLCPQEDMLFRDLTVLQTLEFYGAVKGLTSAVAKSEAHSLLEKLKLTDWKDTEASKLSGGQKRKLSLAIAILGGSKVLILDEPTSGMDTEIRREVWELLLELRASRTIILTTHFMEEADFLCDRIAILDQGKVKCHGSPRFLKSLYGTGYILKVVHKDEEKPSVEEFLPSIQHYVKEAKFTCLNGRTMTFELPESKVDAFPDLLQSLEKKRREELIQSYGINFSTLEEAFVRIRRGEEEICLDVDFSRTETDSKTKESKASRVSGWFLLVYQFWILILKKFIFLRRYSKLFLLFSILPALVIIVREVASELDTNPHKLDSGSQSRLTYYLDLYPSSLVMYSGLEQPDRVKLFGDLVRGSGGRVEEVENITQTAGKIFDHDLYTYLRKVNFGVAFKPELLQIFQNDYGVHMVPVGLNFIHNFLLKSSYKDGGIVTSVDNRFANMELLLYAGARSVEKCRILDLLEVSGAQSLFYLIGPLKENFHDAKEMQLMITRSSLYWLSHLLFDALIFFAFLMPLYFGLGLSLQDTLMIENAGKISATLFFWGCGLILFNYVISTLRKGTVGAISLSVLCFFIFTFIVPNLVSLRILPEFFLFLHPSSILMNRFRNFCAGNHRSCFILPLVSYDFVLLGYLIVMDSGVPRGICHFLVNKLFTMDYSVKGSINEDVAKEEEEVEDLIINEDKSKKSPLLVSQIKRWYFKRFRRSPAVRGVSFSVNEGECFGLLGVNGAGKTSTFRMLAGRLPLSQGNTYALSEKLSLFGRIKYLNSVGYCPQSGGLISVFTGRELLTFFARLRGLKSSRARQEMEDLLQKLGLWEYAKEECGTYSGGNKRKLNMAIAAIGGCPLLLLDEPTSGVDPLSRRRIWTIIEEAKRDRKSVVLTSHSMDECDTLCSRLAIMVNGTFRCIGETTTLKNKFGLGFWIQLKVTRKADPDDVLMLKEFMIAKFGPSCQLVDEHLTALQYHVAKGRVDILFGTLRDLKEGFRILESYSASAATLEQVFIHLARNPDLEIGEIPRGRRSAGCVSLRSRRRHDWVT